MSWEDGNRDRSYSAASVGRPRIMVTTRSQKETRLHPESQREQSPANTLISNFRP